MYNIVAIVGRSASGKDTMFNRLLSMAPDDFNKIEEYTTRPQRDEADNSYKFISVEEMYNKYMNRELFSLVTFNYSWEYAFDRNSLSKDKINIGVFSPAQLRALFSEEKEQELPNFRLYILELEASDKTRLMRSLTRESNPDCEEICRRFFADKFDFESLSFGLITQCGGYHQVINTEQILSAGEIEMHINKIREWSHCRDY